MELRKCTFTDLRTIKNPIEHTDCKFHGFFQYAYNDGEEQSSGVIAVIELNNGQVREVDADCIKFE